MKGTRDIAQGALPSAPGRTPSSLRSVLAALLAVTVCASAGIAVAGRRADPTLQDIINAEHRNFSRSRDVYRHPVQTLRFFGLKPKMTVVEVWPRDGWYSEIIAPYVRAKGRYYAARRGSDVRDGDVRLSMATLDARLARHPALYNKVITTELSRDRTEIAPAGSADLVLTFRNVNDWMRFGFDATAFQAMFAALKPGGILGVVEHRANPAAFPDWQALSGYVQERQVIQIATRAGFEFVASSEINANPLDSRRHVAGVWTLPPTLAMQELDVHKYRMIGESDRMTLMFRKP